MKLYKTSLFALLLVMFGGLVTMNSCCDDDVPPTKPVDKGRDTTRTSFTNFYLNGTYWESCESFGTGTEVHFSYDEAQGRSLLAFADYCFADTISFLEFMIYGYPELGKKYTLNSLNEGVFYYSKLIGTPDFHRTYSDSTGYLIITEGVLHNTINGEFSFTARNDSFGDVEITKGKFYNLELK